MVWVLAIVGGIGSPAFAANRYLRPSQLGYGTADLKVARVISKTNLSGATWRVQRVPAGTTAVSGTLPTSTGAWGAFGFTHRLDFSSLNESGSFRLNLQATGENSITFTIGNPVSSAPGYRTLARSLLGFFAVQRCGPTAPWITACVTCSMRITSWAARMPGSP
jgi:hypothetical protein